VSGISDIVAIQAGKYHSIALGNTGNVYAWGQNFNGQLGDGTKSNHSNPGLVFDLGPVQAIAAGANHNLALQTDGTVKAWGFNQFGQLGDGSNETKSKPVSVIQGTGIKEISAGGNHSIALRADGTYAVWGAGFSGQLGLAAYTNQMVPETVTGLASMFLDMTGHWAQGAVEQAAAKGYVDGYQDGTFHPDTLVTRAEFAKMAATALGLKANPAGPGMDWFTPYVEALFLANVYGHEEVHAQWNEPITRQEIARIGVRASDKTLQKQDTAVDLKYAMLTAVKKGLLQGVDGGALGPEQPSNRAQAVTIIERILTLISGGTLSVDVNALSQAERL
jgi:hypothetical protein